MPTSNSSTIEKLEIRIILPVAPSSCNFRKAANMIAPPAPSAAAGVGLVMPPRIEPSTATIKTSGGKTTRSTSFLPNREAAVFAP